MAKINKLSLTMSEINDLQEAYNIIDVSRDGSISVDELQKFFLLEGDISRDEALAAVSYCFLNEFQYK
jgi:Ca2+-binding EF-hand superfamily protein